MEGRRRRGAKYQQLKESEETKTKEEAARLIPNSQERERGVAKESEKWKARATSLEFGSPVLNVAEMKEKNKQLKDAFGISKHFVEGSSFALNRKGLKEDAVARDEREVKVERPRRDKAAKAEKDKGRIKEEIKKIKEENR